MDIKELNEQIKNTLKEYSDDEDVIDFKTLNEDFEQRANSLKAYITHMVDRFKYRTLINMSYPIDQAEDIYLQCTNKMSEMQKEIEKLTGQLIG